LFLEGLRTRLSATRSLRGVLGATLAGSSIVLPSIQRKSGLKGIHMTHDDTNGRDFGQRQQARNTSLLMLNLTYMAALLRLGPVAKTCRPVFSRMRIGWNAACGALTLLPFIAF